MAIYGTDSSTSIHEAVLRAAGTRFSYPRLVSEESDGSLDDPWLPTATADRKFGRLTGGYDFLTHAVAGKHAKIFLAASSPFVAADPAFLAIIDIERSNFRHKANWNDVRTWVSFWRTHHGKHPVGIYVGHSFRIGGEPDDWESDIGPCYWVLPWYTTRTKTGDTLPKEITDISAAYAKAGGDSSHVWSTMRGGKRPTIWQWAGSKIVGSPPSSVDLNAFRGSLAELTAIVTPLGAKPAPGSAANGNHPTHTLPPPTRVYVVQAGDSLSTIAARQLGASSRWPEIYARNRTLIGPDPGHILPGMQLHLPAK